MKKFTILLIILFGISNFVYSQRYEPIIGKSGSVVDFGMIRIVSDWAYTEKDSENSSAFDFGLDIGVGLSTELQNRFDYRSVEGSDYDWKGYTGLLKFRISEVASGPALGLGFGANIPFYHKRNSLGLIAGFYISSALKDIDFDLNIGINPFLTSIHRGKIFGKTIEERPHSFVNLDILFGYKILPFMKLNAGVEMKHHFGGEIKIPISEDETDTEKLGGEGSAWALILGSRIKPKGYPILLDGSIAFGLSGDKNEYDWQFKLGVQLLPQSPDAEW